MFTGVCLSTWGVHGPGGAWSRGVHGPGDVHGPGWCAWSWGGCMVRGCAWSRGVVCLVETPPTATAAGGTHPTGMHSCLGCIHTERLRLSLCLLLRVSWCE